MPRRGHRVRLAGLHLDAGRPLHVAIVGGGPAGTAACRFLVEAGHEAKIFEASDGFGGIWAKTPANKVLYPGLVTNIPTAVMQSFDVDFPMGLASYIEGPELGAYLEAYAQKVGAQQRTTFGVQVVKVAAQGTDEEEVWAKSPWRVTWRDRRGVEEAADFDAVVVASGHYDTPYAPADAPPGRDAWLRASPILGARRVVHSREYTGPHDYAGRAVLVVGGRSSGVDIARQLRSVAKCVYVLEKRCTEVRAVANCTHVPIGAELTVDGELVVGGRVVPGAPVDDVVLATGYAYSFPFLDESELRLDLGRDRRYVAPLYMHIVHAWRPTLCFVGLPLAVPCPLPLFEAQARFIAAHLRQRSSCLAERLSWVEAQMAAVGDRPQDLLLMGGTVWEHMKELARMSGMQGAEYKAYERRLGIVKQVYADRCSRTPALPWDDDDYRRVEYKVDWDSGVYKVVPA